MAHFGCLLRTAYPAQTASAINPRSHVFVTKVFAYQAYRSGFTCRCAWFINAELVKKLDQEFRPHGQ